MSEVEHLDLVVVGAGLSGVGAAHHFQTAFPERSYAVLEARADLGGTWDLFRYPGVRSDSDMATLGYRFRPWTDPAMLAGGSDILRYIRETATDTGVDRHIRYRHEVVAADWSSAESRWHLTVVHDGDLQRMTCDFLLTCTGYYRYDEGFTPDLPGAERFTGTIVHPQQWSEDLDLSGSRVVVIGSGATAVTLVPALAEDAAHVTMLQRSPTYVMPVPPLDPLAVAVAGRLPVRLGYALTRAKNIATHVATYQLSRRRPQLARRAIRRANAALLPEGYDVDTHFNPRYEPWDQRVCVAPDGDLFRCISAGTASVVTDRIDHLDETGIVLTSGERLDADVVVTATGLRLLALGGIRISLDGCEVDVPQTLVYKGMMLGGVPNLAFVMGYTNSSWTLKADLVAGYVVRLLRHMRRTGTRVCVARHDPDMPREPFLDFAAGYVLRALPDFPSQGARAPWKLRQNYYRDLVTMRLGRVDDGVMRFARTSPAADEAVLTPRRV